jgi:hypothetical protein
MLLILFLLTDPVLAKPVNSPSECLSMYRTYLDEYGTSESIPDQEMLNFIGRCLPDNAANSPTDDATYIDGTQHQKLLQNVDDVDVTTSRV